MIESSLQAMTLRIALHGADILRDDAVFCPLGEEKIACYAITPKMVTAAIPAGWNPRDVTAVALYPDHREEVKVAVQGGIAQLELQARRPVMLYAHRAAARLA